MSRPNQSAIEAARKIVAARHPPNLESLYLSGGWDHHCEVQAALDAIVDERTRCMEILWEICPENRQGEWSDLALDVVNEAVARIERGHQPD